MRRVRREMCFWAECRDDEEKNKKKHNNGCSLDLLMIYKIISFNIQKVLGQPYQSIGELLLDLLEMLLIIIQNWCEATL